MSKGWEKLAPGPLTGPGAEGLHPWRTIDRAIPGRLRPRRARFRFARRANRSKTTSEEQEQTSAVAANGLAPRSIHLTPGGPILLADVGPFWLPITTFLVGRFVSYRQHDPITAHRQRRPVSPAAAVRLGQPLEQSLFLGCV